MPGLVASTGTVDIPNGVYPATVLSISLTDPTPNSPNQEPWLKWVFHVYATADGVELSAGSSTKFSAASKARRWAESIQDRHFVNGEVWDYEAFCPKDCMVQVEKDEKGFCKIMNVTGTPKRAPGQAPSASVATPTGVKI
jgi:hypothetical protein